MKQFQLEGNKSAHLVSAMGICQVLSRIIFGWIGDKIPNRALLLSAAVFSAGLLACLVPFLTTYPLMFLHVVIISTGTGSYITLIPTILVDLYGISMIEVSPMLGRIHYLSTNSIDIYQNLRSKLMSHIPL